jgi:type I restriction enzyme S subunit
MYGEGQTRGRCSELQIEATTNQACASILLDEPVKFVRPYLKLVMMASYEANRRLAAGGVQPNLSVGIIKNLRIALPSANEQVRICDEAARRLSVIASVETSLDLQRRRASRLRESILSAAFSGRLVPRDPTEEPATLFLERIAAARVSSDERGSRGRRKPPAMECTA